MELIPCTKQSLEKFEMSEMRRRIYWQLVKASGIDAYEARNVYLSLIIGILKPKRGQNANME